MGGCEKIEELINLSIDGVLSDSAQAELYRHLTSCENCLGYYRALEAISDGIQHTTAEVPKTFKDDVMKKIRQNRTRNIVRNVTRGLAMTACLVLVMYAGLRLMPGVTKNAGLSDAVHGSSAGDGSLDVVEYSPKPTSAPIPEPESSPGEDSGFMVGFGRYSSLLQTVDSDSLDAVLEFLELAKTDLLLFDDLDPDFLLAIKQNDGSFIERKFWVADGVLYCDSPGDGYLYKSVRGFDEFLEFVDGLM